MRCSGMECGRKKNYLLETFSNWKFLKRKNISIFTKVSIFLQLSHTLHRVTLFPFRTTPSTTDRQQPAVCCWPKCKSVTRRRKDKSRTDRRRKKWAHKTWKTFSLSRWWASERLQVLSLLRSTTPPPPPHLRRFNSILRLRRPHSEQRAAKQNSREQRRGREGLFSIYRGDGMKDSRSNSTPTKKRRRQWRAEEKENCEFINESHQLFKSLTKLIDWLIQRVLIWSFSTCCFKNWLFAVLLRCLRYQEEINQKKI